MHTPSSDKSSFESEWSKGESSKEQQGSGKEAEAEAVVAPAVGPGRQRRSGLRHEKEGGFGFRCKQERVPASCGSSSGTREVEGEAVTLPVPVPRIFLSILYQPFFHSFSLPSLFPFFFRPIGGAHYPTTRIQNYTHVRAPKPHPILNPVPIELN